MRKRYIGIRKYINKGKLYEEEKHELKNIDETKKNMKKTGKEYEEIKKIRRNPRIQMNDKNINKIKTKKMLRKKKEESHFLIDFLNAHDTCEKKSMC